MLKTFSEPNHYRIVGLKKEKLETPEPHIIVQVDNINVVEVSNYVFSTVIVIQIP